MTVFLAGSISIKRLTKAVTQRLDSIITKKYDIVVGDAGGVDKAVQRHLHDRRYHSVTVYCINQPRNNLGEWPVESVPITAKRPKRSDFVKKDQKMAERADVGFMIWDDRSPGTPRRPSGRPRAKKVKRGDRYHRSYHLRMLRV